MWSVTATAADFTTQTITVGLRKNMEATLFTPNGPGHIAVPVISRVAGKRSRMTVKAGCLA